MRRQVSVVVEASSAHLVSTDFANPEPVVAGIDPGLRRAGYAVARILPATSDRLIEPIALGVWGTEKSDKRRRVFAADDDFRRAREQAARLSLVVPGAGTLRILRLVAAESMSFPRNARAAAQIAMLWGALAHACETSAIPVVQASPQEIRAALGLPKGASKLDVQVCLAHRFGKDLIEHLLRGVKAADREHPFDALAAIVAATTTDVFRLVRR